MATTANQLAAFGGNCVRTRRKVAAAKTLYEGTMAFSAAGYATDVVASGANPFMGIVNLYTDNASGSAGDVKCETYTEGYWTPTGISHSLTIADVESPIYATDNFTLTTASSGGVKVGTLKDVDDKGRPVIALEVHSSLSETFGSQAKVFRGRFTTAEVNAGVTALPALPGKKYRMHDMALIAIGGNAATATSIDILGTQSASSVKLMDGRVAGLNQSVLLRAGTATNGLILADGASFVACDTNTAITVGKTGSSLATATHVDVLLTYEIIDG